MNYRFCSALLFAFLGHVALAQQTTPDADLLCAAQSCDENKIAAALAQGADVNALNEDHMTPLILAAHGCPVPVLKLLVDARADVNAEDNRKVTALVYAADHPVYYEGIEFLLKSGADPNAKPHFCGTALSLAIEALSMENVLALLRYGADPNMADYCGEAPLIHAADRGNWDAALHLILLGVDMSAANRLASLPEECAGLGWTADSRTASQGLTALHCASGTDDSGALDTMSALINHGADVNAKSGLGETPLMVAASHGKVRSTEILLTGHADPNVTDVSGRTAMGQALIAKSYCQKTDEDCLGKFDTVIQAIRNAGGQ